eukprot:4714248-Alexandrium_andersonii.AAC.1
MFSACSACVRVLRSASAPRLLSAPSISAIAFAFAFCVSLSAFSERVRVLRSAIAFRSDPVLFQHFGCPSQVWIKTEDLLAYRDTHRRL